MGVPLKVGGAGEDHDALHQAPKTNQPERKDAYDHGEDELDDAYSRVAQIKAVNAEAAKENSEQSCRDLRFRLRITVGRIRERRLRRVLRLRGCRWLRCELGRLRSWRLGGIMRWLECLLLWSELQRALGCRVRIRRGALAALRSWVLVGVRGSHADAFRRMIDQSTGDWRHSSTASPRIHVPSSFSLK